MLETRVLKNARNTTMPIVGIIHTSCIFTEIELVSTYALTRSVGLASLFCPRAAYVRTYNEPKMYDDDPKNCRHALSFNSFRINGQMVNYIVVVASE